MGINSATTAYTDDNNGNVTAIGSLDYTWDWRNRLASAERTGGGAISYLNARYYQGSRGQFLSQDPVFINLGVDKRTKEALADPQLQNSYSYGRNNPITLKDPDGAFVFIGSRPIGGRAGFLGAHTYIGVIPDNPTTIGAINIGNVSTARPFTLGGYTDDYIVLYKQANQAVDYSYAFGNQRGSAFANVAPPEGIYSEEFDRRVVAAYNSLPGVIAGNYNLLGQSSLTGRPNSNNVSSSILRNAGVSQTQINQYQYQLAVGNSRWAPGVGQSLPASSVGISGNTQITLGNFSSVISMLMPFIKR
jgi:RHS repeat-associated protein